MFQHIPSNGEPRLSRRRSTRGSGRTPWKTGPFAWPSATRATPWVARPSRCGPGLLRAGDHDADSRPSRTAPAQTRLASSRDVVVVGGF